MIALVTGINGQDGSYLCELLLEKGYDVHGIVRSSSQFNRSRIDATRDAARKRGQVFELHYGNLADGSSLHRILLKVKPDEVYNLASHSHVAISFEEPEYVTDVDATGVLRLLEAVRASGIACRVYQASTSELFGQPPQSPQTEDTPFYPRSPYGVAKLYAYWIVRNYREIHGMHLSNGILYNHESPRRGENFVTRKITYSLARVKAGTLDVLSLGNLDARRDWGYAGDYVQAMFRMLQMPQGNDYIIATGVTHSVREFVQKAAAIAGFSLQWQGSGLSEKGIDTRTGRTIVTIDPRHYRPVEKVVLCGDPTRARQLLNWQPTINFDALVTMMMEYDLNHIIN